MLLQYCILGLEIITGLYIVFLIVNKLKSTSNPNSPLVHLAAFLGKAMEEDKGEPSLTRWNNFYALLIWAPGILFGYVWVISHGNFKDLVLPFTNSLLGAISLLLGLKLGHDYIVNKNNSQGGN